MEIKPFVERRPWHYRDKLPPLSGRVIRVKQNFNGILETIKVRFWGNTALQIQVIPFIEKLRGGAASPLIEFHSHPFQSRNFIDGDDETATFNVKIPYKKDEIIGFIIQNIHSINSYDYKLWYEFILLDK